MPSIKNMHVCTLNPVPALTLCLACRPQLSSLKESYPPRFLPPLLTSHHLPGLLSRDLFYLSCNDFRVPSPNAHQPALSLQDLSASYDTFHPSTLVKLSAPLTSVAI